MLVTLGVGLFPGLLRRTNQNVERKGRGVMPGAGTFLHNFDQSECTVSHGRDVARWNFSPHRFDQSEWRTRKKCQQSEWRTRKESQSKGNI